MKFKIKLKIKTDKHDRGYKLKSLVMKIKCEGEIFYKHEHNIIYNYTEDYFWPEAKRILSNKEEIIKIGKKVIEDIMKKKIKNVELKNNKKIALNLLKQYKKPITIEIKE
jgi:DNA replicative helicase MCM subunit Mcm2 (Cdc46/Mcm family)